MLWKLFHTNWVSSRTHLSENSDISNKLWFSKHCKEENFSCFRFFHQQRELRFQLLFFRGENIFASWCMRNRSNYEIKRLQIDWLYRIKSKQLPFIIWSNGGNNDQLQNVQSIGNQHSDSIDSWKVHVSVPIFITLKILPNFQNKSLRWGTWPSLHTSSEFRISITVCLFEMIRNPF